MIFIIIFEIDKDMIFLLTFHVDRVQSCSFILLKCGASRHYVYQLVRGRMLDAGRLLTLTLQNQVAIFILDLYAHLYRYRYPVLYLVKQALYRLSPPLHLYPHANPIITAVCIQCPSTSQSICLPIYISILNQPPLLISC
jgi:hypothetical protein